jgi:hypothetical protein
VSIGAEIGGGDDGVSNCSCSKLVDDFNWRKFFGLDIVYNQVLEIKREREYVIRLTDGGDDNGSNMLKSLNKEKTNEFKMFWFDSYFSKIHS